MQSRRSACAPAAPALHRYLEEGGYTSLSEWRSNLSMAFLIEGEDEVTAVSNNINQVLRFKPAELSVAQSSLYRFFT